MEFARRELEKYGWKDGKGLGRHETGMTKAITPKLKFDNTGIGHDYSEEFTYNWWENVYDSAARNVTVKANENGVSVNVSDTDLDITNKKYAIKKSKKSKLIHGRFFKTATLHADGSIDDEAPNVQEETKVTESNNVPMTDEKLFRICGGRTAHKGARHGLKLNGKLARIEEQDKQLLERISRCQSSKKRKNSDFFETSQNSENQSAETSEVEGYEVHGEIITDTIEDKKKRKKKKKKKEKDIE